MHPNDETLWQLIHLRVIVLISRVELFKIYLSLRFLYFFIFKMTFQVIIIWISEEVLQHHPETEMVFLDTYQNLP